MVEQKDNNFESLVRELVRYGILAVFGGCKESARKYKEIESKLKSLYSDEKVVKKIEEVMRNGKCSI